MRARLLVSRIKFFVDDSRSGINTSGFCFWNIMIINQYCKSHSVMGDMTMVPSDAAAYWVLRPLMSMCPPTIDIITKTMSDLGLGMKPINNALPNSNISAACTWHIMLIDFPKNLKHIPENDSCKSMYKIILLGTLCPRLSGKPIWLTPVENGLVIYIFCRNLHVHSKGGDHHDVSRTSL